MSRVGVAVPFLIALKKNLSFSVKIAVASPDPLPLPIPSGVDLILINKRDMNEWDRVFPELYGPALQKIRGLNKAICKGHLPLETMEDLATEAVTLAFHKMVQFKSASHVIGHVVDVAKYRTMTFAKSAYGWRSIQGRFDSLDAKPENDAESKPPPQLPDDAQPSPDEFARKADYLVKVTEVLAKATSADRELLHEKFVLRLPEREIGERRGWETNTVGNRIKQACGRVKKLLKSDLQLSTKIKELGFEHHFDE